jgi:hypothetical protein
VSIGADTLSSAAQAKILSQWCVGCRESGTLTNKAIVATYIANTINNTNTTNTNIVSCYC